MTPAARSRRGFTLVEALGALAILGVVIALVMPVIHGASTNTVAADRARGVVEKGAYAADRIARLIRDCPTDAADPTALGITTALDTSLMLADGRGVSLSGSTLLYHSPASPGGEPLAEDVSSLEFRYLMPDGESTTGDPAKMQRIEFALVIGGVELRSVALPRVRMVTP